jgi:hypothetical protein
VADVNAAAPRSTRILSAITQQVEWRRTESLAAIMAYPKPSLGGRLAGAVWI